MKPGQVGGAPGVAVTLRSPVNVAGRLNGTLSAATDAARASYASQPNGEPWAALGVLHRTVSTAGPSSDRNSVAKPGPSRFSRRRKTVAGLCQSKRTLLP